ncbi:MAG TPA: hypothetical protein EYQ64_08545 [Gemmatimonadetes bacterium]|nr:hypothetical protein [Gemmatimonadota bacterium]
MPTMNNMPGIKKWLSWVGRSGQARNWAAAGLVALSATFSLLFVDRIQAPQYVGGGATNWSPPEVVSPALADAQLPIEVNERIEQWMVRFTTSRQPAFEVMLSRGGLYSDMIRGKLSDRGMPEELVYLAMIESGFHTDARSYVAATGMWQFMDPTARAYGLRIDQYVDERRDPVRATDAALDYLSDLYQRYGSWYLAAAAYNAGPTRVSLAVARYSDGRMGDENVYWEIIDHLPKETVQYVPKLLAARNLARSAALYGLDVTLEDPYVYDLVWAPGGSSLEEVGKRMGLSDGRMRELNPQLIRGVTPPGGVYPLRVPVGQAYTAMSALAGHDLRSRLADD